MKHASRTEPSASWVDEKTRRVSRSIFSDQKIFDLEIDRIFNRSWLFLAHESELPSPGDFVKRPMGSDQVLVVRGEDGVVRGFLNACPHRGMAVCRADAGRTQRFVCPYHSWTFDTKGALRTTTYDANYEHADFAKMGLTRVPRLDSYQGLIFGNWNANAISLDEHLGDLKWYMDLAFGRTPEGMTVLGPPQRWVIETNWKTTAINFIDSQHALRTHAGLLSMSAASGGPTLDVFAKNSSETPLVTFPQGHGVIIGPWAKMGTPDFFGYPPEVVDLYKQKLAPDQLEELRSGGPSVATIFPNTSWVEGIIAVDAALPPRFSFNLKTWQPLDAGRIEIWSWYLAEAEATAETHSELIRLGAQTLGIGGTVEQDDTEVWASITSSIKGSNASLGTMDFSAGITGKPVENDPRPGTVYACQQTEHAQFGFLRRWNQMMSNGLSGDPT